MSAEKIVNRLLEDDEPVDPKAYATGEHTQPSEITIVGRRWFRRGAGGTFHTANISIDGRYVHSTTYQYGYGDQYLETGWQWLEDNGYVPRRDRANGGNTAPWRAAQDLGIKLNYYAVDVKRQKDL
jgi:hypothetical protein